MLQLKPGRAVRLATTLLALGLAAAAAPRSHVSAAPAQTVTIGANGARLWIDSPFLHLEFDLRNPALDVVRVAPNGDGQVGGNLGAILEEAAAAGQRLRSSTDDADGARASWLNAPEGLKVRFEGVDAGGLASSAWTMTVPSHSPSLRIDRLVTLRGNVPVESVGLAIISPTVLEGTDPATLARLINGGAYRSEVGPLALDQAGNVLGLLAVDHPEFTFSARSEHPDRLAVRQEGGYTSLSFVRRLSPPRQSGQVQDSVVFNFGWQNDFLAAHSDFAPDVESRLLGSGYFGNAVFSPVLGPVLSASMRDYRGSVWSRDTDYALQGYGYVLNDMSVFRNTVQKFLERVDRNGVAPEYMLLDGQYGNRQSWDSMANVVQAIYSYVAKTGDLDFYRHHQESVKKALGWIRALDTDGDGLPDRDIFPFGYTDTVENGPMHTYAIAKFYAAFLSVAELEEASGHDGRGQRNYARSMQVNFARPLAEGGYWNPDAGHPIAWKRADGQVYTNFETFGVFEAIRVGLLNDPSQLESIGKWLDEHRGAFLNGNTYPERLMIGGYDLRVKKPEVPFDKLWIMDSNAPWITGLSVPARVRLGRLDDAREMFNVYASSSNRSTPHAEFGAGPLGAYGPGETADGGRLWDNWSWFSAVYGTHFGLKMTPRLLEISPAPLDPVAGRNLYEVTYQGARLQMTLFDGGYRFTLDAPRRVLLRPPLWYSALEVNADGNVAAARELVAQPGVPYVIQAYR